MRSIEKTRRLRGLVALAGVASVVAALAGCSPSSSGPSSAGDGELTEVEVATYATSNMAAVHVGMQQGFFEEEGLEININEVGSGSEQITGLVSGTFDFVCVGYPPLFTAAAEGMPLRILTGNDAGGTDADDDWQVTLTGADSDIASAEDLPGKTVGVNQLKGTAEVMIRASLAEKGIDADEVEFVEVPFTEVPAVLASGTVDAAFATEPFITQVLDDGGKIIDTPYSDLGEHFPNGIWATSAQTASEEPEVTEAFRRAITKSLEFSAENPDVVREVIPTYTSLPEEVVQKIRLPIFTADLDHEQIEKLLEYSQEYGVVKGDVDLDELMLQDGEAAQ